LKVGVKAVGEFLIFGRIADEAGMEFQGRATQRFREGGEALRNAHTAEERLGYLTLAAVDGVEANRGEGDMNYFFS